MVSKQGVQRGGLIVLSCLLLVGLLFITTYSSASTQTFKEQYYLGELLHFSFNEGETYSVTLATPSTEYHKEGVGESFTLALSEVGNYTLNITSNESSLLTNFIVVEEVVESFPNATLNETLPEVVPEVVPFVEPINESVVNESVNEMILLPSAEAVEGIQIKKAVKWRVRMNHTHARSFFVKGSFNVSYRNFTDRASLRAAGSNEGVEIEYYTPAPAVEETNASGVLKEVHISSPEEFHYVNVSAFTLVPETTSDSTDYAIYWKEMELFLPFEAQDSDQDGLIDTLHWIVPHLSNQTFEIILATHAQHLDANRTLLSDIFDSIKALDDIWSEVINSEEYVRITFERELERTNDITLYPRIVSGTPYIEVYAFNQTTLIALFPPLVDNVYNRVLLSELSGTQSTFDLRILNGSVSFDHIIDPPTFTVSQLIPHNQTQNVTSGTMTEITNPEGVNPNPTTGVRITNLCYSQINRTGDAANCLEAGGSATLDAFFIWNITLPEYDAFYNLSLRSISAKATNVVENLSIAVFNWSSNTWRRVNNSVNPGLGVNTTLTYFIDTTLNGSFVSGRRVMFMSYTQGGNNADLRQEYFTANVSYFPSDQVPTVTLLTPSNYTLITNATRFFNASISDDYGLVNATFYLWNSSGGLINQTTRTVSGTSATVNLTLILPYEGIFSWNVDAVDDGNQRALASGNFTLIYDVSTPLIDYGALTPLDGLNSSDDSLFVNITLNESNFANITYSLYNSTGLVNSTTYFSRILTLNWTALASEQYFYNVSVVDVSNKVNTTRTRRITLDPVPPLIDYGALTPLDGLNSSDDSLFVNITLNEANFANITYRLFNSTSLVNTTTYFTPILTINWTTLTSERYTYNVSVSDSVGNFNTTSSRRITLDSITPNATLLSPANNSFSTNPLANLTVNISDNLALANITLFVFNSTAFINETVLDVGSSLGGVYGISFEFPRDDNYSWSYRVTDEANNRFFTFNHTLRIDVLVGVTTTQLIPHNQTQNVTSGSMTEITNPEGVNPNPTTATRVTNLCYSQINRTGEGGTCLQAGGSATLDALFIWNVTLPEYLYLYNVTLSSVAAKSANVVENLSIAVFNWSSNTWRRVNNANNPAFGVNTSLTFVITSATQNNFVSDRQIMFMSYTQGGNNADILQEFFSANVTYLPVDQAPVITLLHPSNGSTISNVTQFFNASVSDDGALVNSTFYLWDESGVLVNSTTLDLAGASTVANITIFLPLEGSYFWNFEATDNANQISRSAFNFTFTLDVISPQISYTTNTPLDGINVTRDSLFVNVSINVSNFANITYKLFNTTSLVNSTTYFTRVLNINWTDLATERYTYNVSVSDLINFANSTISQQITIDPVIPNATLLSPINNTYLGSLLQNMTVNVSDTFALANITLFIYNRTNVINLINTTALDLGSASEGIFGINYQFPRDGNYSWSYRVTDEASNSYFTPNNTLFIDSFDPFVNYTVGTAIDGVNVSRNSIFVNVTLNETNFANITYRLYNFTSLVNITTYSTRTLTINWTGLSNAVYFYNVSVIDLANHFDMTLSRQITVDREAPNATLLSPLNTTYSNISLLNMTVNVSDTFALANITLFIYNRTNIVNLINTTVIDTGSAAEGLYGVNYQFPRDGNYTWGYRVSDEAGNSFFTSNYTLVIDTIDPFVNYTVGTAIDGFNTTATSIFVNVTLNETNFANITYRLYNTTSLVNLTTYTTRTLNINWTALADDVYFYNVTLVDLANNVNSTPTRRITIKSRPPAFLIYSPLATTYTNTSVLINVSLTSEGTLWFFNGTANESYTYGSNGTYRNFNDEQNTTVIFYANDSLGNTNRTNVTFFIHATPIFTFNDAFSNSLFVNVSILTDYSNSLYDLKIDFYNSTLLSIYLYGYNKSSNRTLQYSNYTNESIGDISFALATPGMIFDSLNFTINASQTHLYKCLDWNMTSLTCNDLSSWDVISYNTIGQLYNLTLNSTDPGFLQLSVPTNDTLLDGTASNSTPGTEFGARTYIALANYSTGSKHGLITFNISKIPQGVVIDQANLTFYCSAETLEASESIGIGIHLVYPGIFFSEGTGGAGGNACTGSEFCWNNRVASNQFNATPESSLSIADGCAGFNYTFSVTSGVNYAYLNQSRNVTFYLLPNNSVVGTVTNDEVRLATKEAASAGLRPKLNITYHSIPQVRLILPQASSGYNVSSLVELRANVSDSLVSISTVSANITLPNGTILRMSLVNLSSTIFSVNVSQTSLLGQYNITFIANNSDGYFNMTTTTHFLVQDLLFPRLSFVSPTSTNGTYLPRSSLSINLTVNESNILYSSLYVYNATTLINTSNSSQSIFFFNISTLADGIYHFNATTCDIALQCNYSETRFVIIDTFFPQISIVSPTLPNGTRIEQDFIFVNVSLNETNFANITYRLFNSTSLVNSTTYTTRVATINWTSLPIGNYTYNISIFDLANNQNTSLDSFVFLFIDSPLVYLFSPLNGLNFSTYTINQFNFSVNDSSSILNCSLYGNWSGVWALNQTILNTNKNTLLNFSSVTVTGDGFYSWNVYCYDQYSRLGYNLTNYTFSTFLPPLQPLLLNVTQSTNDGTGSVVLSWNSTLHALKYQIYSGTNPNALALVTETSNTTYTDSTFSGNRRKFYQILAINPSGQNTSVNFFSAQVYTLAHTTNTRNWIGYSSNITYLRTANDSLYDIRNATAFTYWNASQQKRVTCNSFSCPGAPFCTDTNCNFVISQGQGYEVSVNTSSANAYNWSNVGITYSSPVVLSLIKNTTGGFGKNWISLYYNTTLTNARTLISNISNSDSVSLWDNNAQTSRGYIRSPFPTIPFIGTNFSLELEGAYEVSVNTSMNWTQL